MKKCRFQRKKNVDSSTFFQIPTNFSRFRRLFPNFNDIFCKFRWPFKKKKKKNSNDRPNQPTLTLTQNTQLTNSGGWFRVPSPSTRCWQVSLGWVQNQLGLTWPVDRPNLNTLTINLDFHLESIECSCVYSIIYNMMIWHVRIRVCKTWVLHYILIEFNLRKSISYHIDRYDWSLLYQCLGQNKNIAF